MCNTSTCQHSGSVGSVGRLVSGPVGCDRVEVASVSIGAGQNQVGSDVSLVPEQHLLEQVVGRLDPDLPVPV